MRMLELRRDWRMNKGLYLLIIPVVIYLIVFNYVPMAGIVLGFERFTPKNGVYMSEWVGLKHFTTFFSSVFFIRVLKNTLILSLYSIIFGFPAPILFALLLNELDNEYYKKVIQVVSYMPNFISTVVISGIIIDFVASDGVITDLLVGIGGGQKKGRSTSGVAGHPGDVRFLDDMAALEKRALESVIHRRDVMAERHADGVLNFYFFHSRNPFILVPGSSGPLPAGMSRKALHPMVLESTTLTAELKRPTAVE